LRTLLTAGHNQQGDLVTPGRVQEQGPPAAKLDVIGMSADGKDFHS
jgi:hypothetical protein